MRRKIVALLTELLGLKSKRNGHHSQFYSSGFLRLFVAHKTVLRPCTTKKRHSSTDAGSQNVFSLSIKRFKRKTERCVFNTFNLKGPVTQYTVLSHGLFTLAWGRMQQYVELRRSFKAHMQSSRLAVLQKDNFTTCVVVVLSAAVESQRITTTFPAVGLGSHHTMHGH